MFINDDADVIINNGTITGGYSNSEGGAICMEDGTATFNNVLFKNNQSMRSNGRGAAIYALDSDIRMNDCTFDGNGIRDDEKSYHAADSTVYAEDCKVTVRKSTFINNGSTVWQAG